MVLLVFVHHADRNIKSAEDIRRQLICIDVLVLLFHAEIVPYDVLSFVKRSRFHVAFFHVECRQMVSIHDEHDVLII